MDFGDVQESRGTLTFTLTKTRIKQPIILCKLQLLLSIGCMWGNDLRSVLPKWFFIVSFRGLKHLPFLQTFSSVRKSTSAKTSTKTRP